MNSKNTQSTYFPPPESKGGWRYVNTPDEIRSIAGMNPEKLRLIQRNEEFFYGGDSWSIIIIRHGYIVGEFFTFNVLIPSRFDIYSGTKSFTGTAWGMLLDDSRLGTIHGGVQIDLDSKVYDYLPEGHPLSDSEKSYVTIRHLLTMTSGIKGEKFGVFGIPTTIDNGPFENALGRCPNRYGVSLEKLASKPGTCWDYSDPAFAHLALAFSHITGSEIDNYLNTRIFKPIGIENLSWDVQGGSGFLGPHTNAHAGIHISARELARFGYLMLNNGSWESKQLIPKWWIDLSTKTSQDHNPNYGYTWWVNTHGTMWKNAPLDTYALRGYRSNSCFIIPSLDLVIARVGSGPAGWHDPGLVESVVSAVIQEKK